MIRPFIGASSPQFMVNRVLANGKLFSNLDTEKRKM
jgi:hypothetical protein